MGWEVSSSKDSACRSGAGGWYCCSCACGCPAECERDRAATKSQGCPRDLGRLNPAHLQPL